MVLPVFGFPEEETELDIEELRRRIYGEAPGELMGYSLGDSEVSLFLTGMWMGTLQGNLGFSLSPLGLTFASPETPLLFKQEVDLSLSLWINDRWFLEANFQDDHTLNTYRAGYQGLSGEFLQYAGIGNTGLDFPAFVYLDLGGDSPSSFGFYSRFGSNALTFHTLLRYDTASREEKVFSGGRERTSSDISPQNFVRVMSFVLPDKDIDSEIIVFIEDESGNIIDNNGRRWRYAQSGEYWTSGRQGLLELNVRPNGMVAVSYFKEADIRPWDTSMGSYDTEGFLHEVQTWFGSNIDLGNYPQCGNRIPLARRPGEMIFGGAAALVIYEPGAFSPFERLNRYNAPSSASERAVLVQISTGNVISGFELVRLEDAQAFDIPMLTEPVRGRNIYEIVNLNYPSEGRSEVNRWPLAKIFPEIYLPLVNVFTGDMMLRFTSYSGTSGFFIGTDVIPASVQVWRSGIQSNNFSYSQTTGEVTIQGAIGENELIRITYLKTNEGMRLGSLTAGFGAIYNNKTSPFSAQAAVGIRWNLTDGAFTDENITNEGTAGISAKTAWEYDFLNANITAGLAVVQTDTTGLYRIAGMEGSESILHLPPNASFISNAPGGYNINNRVDLIFRNYFNNNMLGSNLMYIEWDTNVVTGINDKPYTAKDRQLGDNQILVAEFELNEEKHWTGFQVPLDIYGEILSRAAEIEIPFRFYDFAPSSSTDFRLIIQIGSLSPRDFPFTENPQLIWEEILFQGPESVDFERTRLLRFILNDEQRRKLGDAKYLRLIVDGLGYNVSGRILLAPPIVRGSIFRAITVEGGVVNGVDESVKVSQTMEIQMPTLESSYPDIIKRLHPEMNAQRVLRIDWNDMDGVSAGVDGRIGEIPLADYRELSFFVKGPQPKDTFETIEGNLRFIIGTGPDSLKTDSFSARQLEALIPLSAFSHDEWRKVTIRYQGNNTGFKVDKSGVTGPISYRPLAQSMDDTRRTSYTAILIDPGDSILPAGTLYIDEIILEEPLMVYRMNAGAFVEYSRPGTLLSFGEIPMLADFFVYSALESETRAKSDYEDLELTGSMLSRTGLGLSVFGISVTGNLAFTAAQETFLWNADHSISRTSGNFSVRETFFASPQTHSVRHGFNMAFLSDFHFRFDADAFYDFSRLRQRWNLITGYRPQNDFFPSVALNTEAVWTTQEQIDENENYASLWLRTFQPLIPDNGSTADSRRTLTSIVLTQRTIPVGVILNLQGSTNFTGANNITRSENSVFLDIPILMDRTRMNFRAGRGFRRHLYFAGESVSDDGMKFFESISDSLPLWGIFPFYSLFAQELNDVMDRTLSNSPSADQAFYTSFNDHFSTRISLPPIYEFPSLFIPSRITLRLDRLLEQRMDTRSDNLTVIGGLGFSSINMFGAFGSFPVFNFYQTDEFSHSIEASFIIPEYEDISWRIQSVFGAGFRGFTGDELNFSNMFSIHSDGYWTESFAAVWEAATERSMLSVFYDWMTKSLIRQNFLPGISTLFGSPYEQLRRESLEITFDKSSDYLRWSMMAGHEEIIRVLGRLNFSSYMKLRINNDKRTETFTFDALLGTTFRVMF